MGKRVTAVISLTLGILMIGSTLALASSVDTAVIDASAPTGEVSLGAGQQGAIRFTFSVTGNQLRTCSVSYLKDWTLSAGTFTGANAGSFSVGPQGPGTTTTYGPFTGSLSIAAGQSTGSFTLAIKPTIGTCTGTGASLSLGNASNYAVTVVAPSDSTPPVIAPSIGGTLGAHGYYTSNVALSWSVTDAQSSILGSTGCGSTTVSTDTNGATVTCRATSAGGTNSQSVTIKRDATPPTMTASLSTAANGAGWNNSPVVVTFSCSDATGSGIDPAYPCPESQSLTANGLYALHMSTADMAGNAITPNFTVKIDAEVPTISGSATPAANGNGWRKQAVSVHYDCFDGASGLASCTGDDTLSSEGANQSSTGTATDNAGNHVSTTVGDIDIDLTPPWIHFVGTLPSGWVNQSVTLGWNCTDTLSGPAVPSVTATLDEGGDQSATGACDDKAGNSASDTQSGIDVDLTPPTISFASRTANTNGWNDGPVSVTWTCTDDLSGVVHDSVMDVVTTEGANQTAKATCEDLAGNKASDQVDDVSIDETAPSISGSATPGPNVTGWNNTNVRVTFACVDNAGGSGIATDTVQGDTLTDNGVDQSVSSSGDCVDEAGNAATSATVSGIRIDKTAPVITGHIDPEANDAGWNSTNVTVSFTCADEGGSGIAHDLSGMTLSIDGTDLEVTNSGTCVDGAGNAASPLTVGGINIDQTKPVITGHVSPDANTNSWNNTDVTVTFSCADGGSGVDYSDVGGATLTEKGAGQSVTSTGTCVDKAGNIADAATVSGINIDQSNPVITGHVSSGANGAGWHHGDVDVTFACADEGPSGVDEDSVAGNTLTDNGAGQSVTNTGICTDKAGNVADPVTVSGINIDHTSPVIAGSASPQANAKGWNNSDVTVGFTCTDEGGSLIALNTVAGDALTDNVAGQSVTNSGTCVDTAGNVAADATIDDINIDHTRPVITGHVAPGANGNGWHNTAVGVTFTCADTGGSLIDENSVEGYTLTTDGAGQSVTNGGLCTDNAGNQASAVTVSGINIDTMKPVITGSAPTGNANGWQNTDVPVGFTCADEASGSGVATDTVTGSTLTGEAASQSVTNGGTCVDAAGNVADTATVIGINIDKSAPVITSHGPSITPDGVNGWYVSAVSNGFTADGLVSGLADPSKSSFSVSSGSAQGVAVNITSGSVSDRAGNINGGIDSAAFKIDLSSPTDVAFSGGPAANGAYLFGAMPAAPSCSASDTISGLASCVVTGYSALVGPHTLTATATDNAGRTTTITRTYTVNPWTLKGFYAPVDTGGVWNTVKNGATVPLKFEIFSGATELSDVAAIQGFTVKGVSCPGSLAVTDDIELTTTGGTTLRYDSTGGQLIQNWQTPRKVGACYTVTMTTVDGSMISANFKLK